MCGHDGEASGLVPAVLHCEGCSRELDIGLHTEEWRDLGELCCEG